MGGLAGKIVAAMVVGRVRRTLMGKMDGMDALSHTLSLFVATEIENKKKYEYGRLTQGIKKQVKDKKRGLCMPHPNSLLFVS